MYGNQTHKNILEPDFQSVLALYKKLKSNTIPLLVLSYIKFKMHLN